MPKDVILTPEGLEKLKDELEHLRPRAPRGRRADQGSARVRRHLGELRVRRRQERAGDARGADRPARGEAALGARSSTPASISTDVVQVGSIVNVKDEKTGKSQKYTIVGSAEANPAEQRLSNESPVGRALIGRKRGDIVAVAVPNGPARKLKITKIDVGSEPGAPWTALRDEPHRADSEAVSDAAEPELSELLAARRAKLERLRADGIEPFPHAFPGVVADRRRCRAAHDGLEAGEETEARYRVAGRLAARRGQGKMAFLDLVDRSGRIQLQARADVLGEEPMERLLDLDLGDLIGVDGIAFMSRRGELTLRVDDFDAAGQVACARRPRSSTA